MRISQITAEFKADPKTVWDIVSDNGDYTWRSDLSEIIVSPDGSSFTEVTVKGEETHFTITKKEPYSRYEFDMENKMLRGHWEGVFTEMENGGTKITFREEVHVKNPAIELLSRFVFSLKKVQEAYIADLRRKLGEN